MDTWYAVQYDMIFYNNYHLKLLGFAELFFLLVLEATFRCDTLSVFEIYYSLDFQCVNHRKRINAEERQRSSLLFGG